MWCDFDPEIHFYFVAFGLVFFSLVFVGLNIKCQQLLGMKLSSRYVQAMI